MIKSKVLKTIICLLLLCTLVLTGCAREDELQGEANTNADTQFEDTSGETEAKEEFVSLFGGEEEYKLLQTDSTGAFGDSIQDFLSKVRTKTGIKTIFASKSYNTEVEKEVFLGSIGKREASKEIMDNLLLNAYSVKFVGEKLAVSAHTPELLTKALDGLLEAIHQGEDGTWGVYKSLDIYVSTNEVDIKIPEFETQSGALVGTYISNSDKNQTAYTNISESDYSGYISKLEADGFEKYSENTIGENKFATYVDSITEVHLIWFKSIGNFRIVFSQKGYLPPQTAPQYTKVKDATVTQLARYGAYTEAPGEGYIIQLEDGSFIVIDGGPTDANDRANLLQYMRDNKPASHTKPKVMWMFTHLHSDHTALAINFLIGNQSNIELTAVCFNFPSATALEEGGTESTYNTIMAIMGRYSKAEAYVFHSGQKMKLAGCEIEFLYTQEDHWPNKFTTANDTSAVWRMTFTGGHDFLVLGDSEVGVCQQVTAIYGDYLESDVLQPSHHGFNGATAEIYEAIDPKICLWPVDENRFLTDGRCLGTQSGYAFNQILRNQGWTRAGGASGTRQHYTAGRTTTVKMSDLTVTAGDLIM